MRYTREATGTGGRASSHNRKASIVDAAFDIIAQRGCGALSTTELAERVGISQPAIFRHYRTKSDLWCAIVDASGKRIMAACSPAVANPESWRQADLLLRQTIECFAEAFSKTPAIAAVLVAREIADADRQAADLASLHRRRPRDLLTKIVGRAKEQERMPDTLDAENTADMLMSLIFGLALQWLASGRLDQFQLIVEETMGPVITAICSDSSTSSNGAHPSAENGMNMHDNG